LTRTIQPWTPKPVCAKCRKQAPAYRLTRVLPGVEGSQEYLTALSRAQWDAAYRDSLPEALTLTCERCGHEWFMAVAPAEVPR
jgi:hypothetical protein